MARARRIRQAGGSGLGRTLLGNLRLPPSRFLAGVLPSGGTPDEKKHHSEITDLDKNTANGGVNERRPPRTGNKKGDDGEGYQNKDEAAKE